MMSENIDQSPSRLKRFITQGVYYLGQAALVAFLCVWVISMVIFIPYLLAFAAYNFWTDSDNTPEESTADANFSSESTVESALAVSGPSLHYADIAPASTTSRVEFDDRSDAPTLATKVSHAKKRQ